MLAVIVKYATKSHFYGLKSYGCIAHARDVALLLLLSRTVCSDRYQQSV